MELKYNEIVDLFTKETGFDLEATIPDDGSNEVNKGQRFVEKQANLLTTYIRRYNYTFEYRKCSNERKQALNSILVKQLLFACENGLPETFSGIDINTNSVIDADKIFLAHISPIVKSELQAQGFLYRGII